MSRLSDSLQPLVDLAASAQTAAYKIEQASGLDASISKAEERLASLNDELVSANENVLKSQAAGEAARTSAQTDANVIRARCLEECARYREDAFAEIKDAQAKDKVVAADLASEVARLQGACASLNAEKGRVVEETALLKSQLAEFRRKLGSLA